MDKTCFKCKKEKRDIDFSPAQFRKNSGWCKECISLGKKTYYNNNKNEIIVSRKEYQQNNKEKIDHYKKQYYAKNRNRILSYNENYYNLNKGQLLAEAKAYSKINRKKISDYQKAYAKNRRKNDPAFKLRTQLSTVIGSFIKKNHESIMKYLPYSIQELRVHLESQFEHWMTWENHKRYDPKTWDDNDSTTWMWHIDHIIPHSKFYYTSMKDQEFKNCWALSNLRPYSAKQNIIDGNRK